jgi:mono/diheme cytochrome c family protein
MKAILMIFLIVIVSGCSKQLMPESEGTRNVVSQKALHGQTVFMQRCNRCHPEGMAGLGPSLINKPLPGFVIKFQVRTGLGAMPSFNKNILGKKDLDDIVAYLKKK